MGRVALILGNTIHGRRDGLDSELRFSYVSFISFEHLVRHLILKCTHTSVSYQRNFPIFEGKNGYLKYTVKLIYSFSCLMQTFRIFHQLLRVWEIDFLRIQSLKLCIQSLPVSICFFHKVQPMSYCPYRNEFTQKLKSHGHSHRDRRTWVVLYFVLNRVLNLHT